MFNITLRFLHYRYFGGIFWNFEKDLNYGEIRSVQTICNEGGISMPVTLRFLTRCVSSK